MIYNQQRRQFRD